MPAFVGRLEELACGRAAAERALSGQGALLLFSGEPGIGKTRLAERTAAIAAEAGARVVWGRAWEAGGAPAYWPWIQVFRTLGTEDPFATPSVDTGAEAQQTRFRVFDSAVRLLVQAAKDAPLALVLDDLHAADVPTLLLLQLLVRELRGTRLLVIGTYREVEARLSPELGALLAKIAREGDVVPVRRLGPDDVTAWMQQESPSAGAATAEQVYRITEGNPLFVEEVLRLGGALDPVRIPDGLRAALDEHVARVSAQARALLEAAAVLGREFSRAELLLLSGADAHALDDRLREAVTAGIVVPLAERRFAFAHMLLRDRLYAELAPAQRAELHWQAGEMLLAARGDASTAAHHLLEGHSAGDLERALGAARSASDAAVARHAFEDAVRIGERALAAVEGRAPTRSACETLLGVAEALMRCGETQRGRDACQRAAQLARELDAGDLVARAALAYGTNLISAVVDATMVSLLRDALARLPTGDAAVRARVMARLAAALVPPSSADDASEVRALARESRAMARRVGNPHTLLYTLQFAASASGYMVTGEERFALLDEVISLATSLENRLTIVNLGGWHVASLLEAGRRGDADAALQDYARLLEEFPQPHYQWRLPLLRAGFAAFDGDLDLAARLGDEGRALAERANAVSGRVAWALQRIALAQARGEPRSIVPDAQAVLEILERVPALLPYSAWMLVATGRVEEGIARLQHVANALQTFPWLIIACDACVIAKDQPLAAMFHPALAQLAFAQRAFWGPAGAFMLGPTSRTLGDLALLMGDASAALGHYDDSIAMCERIGARPLLALSRRGRELALQRGAEANTAASTAPVPPTSARPVSGGLAFTLRREGDVWSIERAGCATLRLKDAKGFHYLEKLVQSAGRDVHVFDLVGTDEAASDAGPALDARAKEQYRGRVEDLREELDEAERFGDAARTARARDELDAIAEQLAGAVGLGGRDRKAASNVERARINVQRRLKDAIDRVAAQDPAFGRYLGLAVKTGTYCSFTPI